MRRPRTLIAPSPLQHVYVPTGYSVYAGPHVPRTTLESQPLQSDEMAATRRSRARPCVPPLADAPQILQPRYVAVPGRRLHDERVYKRLIGVAHRHAPQVRRQHRANTTSVGLSKTRPKIEGFFAGYTFAMGGDCSTHEKPKEERPTATMERVCRVRECGVRIKYGPPYSVRAFCDKHMKNTKLCCICNKLVEDANEKGQCFDCTKVYCSVRHSVSCTRNVDIYRPGQKGEPLVSRPDVVCDDCSMPCQGGCGWYLVTPDTVSYNWNNSRPCPHHHAQQCVGLESVTIWDNKARGVRCRNALPFPGPKLCKNCYPKREVRKEAAKILLDCDVNVGGAPNMQAPVGDMIERWRPVA